MRRLLVLLFALCVCAAEAAPTKAQLKEVADEAWGIMKSAHKPSKTSVANLIRGLNKSMRDGHIGFIDALRIIRRLRPVLNEANVSAGDLLKLQKDISAITGKKLSKADLENILKVVLPVINTAYPSLKQ
jgi:hypothetical protein